MFFSHRSTQSYTTRRNEQGTDEMRPILYVFLGVLIAGSLFQLSIVRGRRRKASRERDRQEFDVERGYGRHSSGGATARVWE